MALSRIWQNAIIQTKIVKLHRSAILMRLTNLRKSPEMFGEVDLENHQQVELVAYRVAKGVQKQTWWELKRTDEYELVIVGAGSTAAYYLDTLGPAHNKFRTLVIGKDNPWKAERGYGISYVNHTERQIALPSQNVTKYGGNESFVDRQKFGTSMEQRVKTLAGRVVEDLVSKIERSMEKGRSLLKLTTKASGVFFAERVVFVAGSGRLRTPKVDSQYKTAVIDMNTFIRDKATQERPGPVVVWGSNAAIDAVAAAKKHGWDIKAWLYSKGGGPAWLPGTRYLSPPYNLQNVPAYEYADRDEIKIIDGTGPNLVHVHDNKAPKRVASDIKYLIYGLGSGDLLSEVLDKPSVLGAEEGLVPILDHAGVFHNPWDNTPQGDAFLGWGTKDGSLQVFGLAAENYTPPGERMPPTDARVMALKKWLSGDVLTVGQLSYIRTAMRAVNNFVPGSIEHRVDFSHADANQLRIHIASKYPDLPEPFARWFIGVLAEFRKDAKVQERLPHGFTEKQVQFLEKTLQGLENMGKSFDAQFGNLHENLLALTPVKGQEVKTALKKIPRRLR